MVSDYKELLAEMRLFGQHPKAADAIATLQAECDRLREENAQIKLNNIRSVSNLELELDRLREELAAAQRDAARYRWLRLQPFDEVRDTFRMHGTEQQRDTVIDAAMAQETAMTSDIKPPGLWFRIKPADYSDALAAARNAALDEAAKVCGDQVDPHPMSHFDEGYNQAVRDCADAIRALKEKRDE